jgi:hypothetical protein
MYKFATEVAQLVHSLGVGSDVAEKIASAPGSVATQRVVSEGADGLYSVITKQAADIGTPADVHHRQVVNCVVKMAEALGKPIPSTAQLHKLAAVVAADDALEVIKTASGSSGHRTQMQRFGREFFANLLQDII